MELQPNFSKSVLLVGIGILLGIVASSIFTWVARPAGISWPKDASVRQNVLIGLGGIANSPGQTRCQEIVDELVRDPASLLVAMQLMRASNDDREFNLSPAHLAACILLTQSHGKVEGVRCAIALELLHGPAVRVTDCRVARGVSKSIDCREAARDYFRSIDVDYTRPKDQLAIYIAARLSCDDEFQQPSGDDPKK